MTGLEHALLGLRHALDAPRRHLVWRRLVRNRMAGVREALAREEARDGDAWLAAREAGLQRDRDTLVRHLEVVRRDVSRLRADIEHHHQRLNDLVYDSVSLEIGGSE